MEFKDYFIEAVKELEKPNIIELQKRINPKGRWVDCGRSGGAYFQLAMSVNDLNVDNIPYFWLDRTETFLMSAYKKYRYPTPHTMANPAIPFDDFLKAEYPELYGYYFGVGQ